MTILISDILWFCLKPEFPYNTVIRRPYPTPAPLDHVIRHKDELGQSQKYSRVIASSSFYEPEQRTDFCNRFVETEIGECLRSRTEQLSQFRDLGAPDLVHYRRGNGSKEVALSDPQDCIYDRLVRIISSPG